MTVYASGQPDSVPCAAYPFYHGCKKTEKE